MDLKEEKSIEVSANKEEADGEIKIESTGSSSISPILNKSVTGGNNLNELSPKSIESSSNFSLDKEVEKNSDSGTKKEENNGEMGFVPDSELNLIHEEKNEPRVTKDETGDIRTIKLSSDSSESSSKTNLELSPKPAKGYGLKKWRRIRRELNKDVSGSVDSSIVLKRQHSHDESSKRHDNNKSKNIVEDLGTPTDLSIGPLDFHKLVELTGFSIGAHSDNNDDQSSKSSSTASVNKPRHEIGFGRERTKTKNVGLQQRVQRSRSDAMNVSQNSRCDKLRLEKENSSSSIESSSNTNFFRRESGISNGKKSEIGVVDGLENLGSRESHEGSKSAKESMRTSSGIDHFVESIAMLHAAQEALETEIKIFGEISKAATVDDFDEQYEDTEVNGSPRLDDLISELKQKIEHLNYKLEEASTTIKARDSKVVELENLIKKTTDSELEFDDLIKKKVEAEIEILILDNASRNWKILAEDQIALLDEKLKELKDAEDETAKLKGRAEKLDSFCKELLGSESEALKIENKTYKLLFCSIIQLALFLLGVWFFNQLMPPSDEFVPT